MDEAGLQLVLTSSPLDVFINPDEYYLGPYDVITIQGSGLVEFYYRTVVINALGDIAVPILGTISLKGQTIADAKTTIQKAIDTQIKDTEVIITLDRPRQVNVYIGGNIPNPGNYVIPAGTRYGKLVSGLLIENEIITPLINQTPNTIIEASSNRPSYSGLNFDRIGAQEQVFAEDENSTLSALKKEYDLRLVKVTPLYGDERYIDLSGYFNSGDLGLAPYIQDGDRITFTKASGSRATVSISGAVNSPFVGSYRSDDSFEGLLNIAGGFTPDADTSSIILISSENGSVIRNEWALDEIPGINPGDQIIVRYEEVTHSTGSVSIEGEVELPGIFQISDGQTTLAELIEIAGGLTDIALPNGSYLVRNSLDNRGVTSVSSINMSLLTRSSDQFLEGFDYMELEAAMNPNRMAVNLSDDTVLRNTILQNGDRIYIPKNEKTVSLLGQVNSPGFYLYSEERTAQEYIALANGVTIAADSDRVYVIKAGSRAWYKPEETMIESGDIIFVDRIPFEDVSTGRVYEIQQQQLKNQRTQLIISGVGAIVGIITAYVAITR